LGKRGEDLAAAHLAKLGYKILQRNYRQKCGEIDIIAKKGESLVFIEVKTRKSDLFGSPAAAVTKRKQIQISRTAQDYLARNKLFDTPAHFDVVSVLLPAVGNVEIEIIENAFDLPFGW
jgi:putative endonuclease